jgi:hypothetical protein
MEEGRGKRSHGGFVRNLKKRCGSISFLFYFLFSILHLPLSEDSVHAWEWQDLKSEHFIVFFSEDKAFAKEVSLKAEEYYKSIASELGYQRYSGFWTWDNRVKIYIYPDKTAFAAATGEKEWSEGMADYFNKKIVSYVWNQGFLEALLPHEITHLIFRDFVGMEGAIPLWLDEGVAQWMEPKKREMLHAAMRNLIVQGEMLTLDKMMNLDIRQATDTALIQMFYIEAASLVGFLVRQYGSGDFIGFCRQLRDKKNIDEALTFAYPTTVRDLEKLEQKWLEYYGGMTR